MIGYVDKEGSVRITFTHGGKSFSINLRKDLLPMDKITLVTECINSIKNRLGRKSVDISNADKVKFGDCVYLTLAEQDKLHVKLGDKFKSAIRILNNYKMSSGKTYKSDYHAILNWVVKRAEEENGRVIHNPNRQTTLNEFEEELKKE